MPPKVYLMVVRNSIPIGVFPWIGRKPFHPNSDFQEEIKKRSKKIEDPEIQPIDFECYAITYDALFNLLTMEKFILDGTEDYGLRHQLDLVLQLMSGKLTAANKFPHCIIKRSDKLYFCFG